MSKKKRAQCATPAKGPLAALERITLSETVPSLDDFIALGRELHAARLDFFVGGAIPENTLPAIYAGLLVKPSCRYHRMADENARAGIQGVADTLARIAKKPKFWPYVRDELVKFSRLVEAEMKNRSNSIRPLQETPAPALKAKRDKKIEARDKWIYDECCKGTPHKNIISKLAKKKTWEHIVTKQGIQAAAERYGVRHGLPLPRRRR